MNSFTLSVIVGRRCVTLNFVNEMNMCKLYEIFSANVQNQCWGSIFKIQVELIRVLYMYLVFSKYFL